jgi:hypothetical protein
VREEKFWHNNNTLRIDVKRERGGLLLYLGAKSDPSWMLSKCHSPRVIEHLKEGRNSRVLVAFRVWVNE